MTRVVAAALVCLAVTLSASHAAAESRHSVVWRDATFFRYNPLGLVTAAALEYRLRLYDSDHPLFSQNYVSVAATPMLSPVYARLGGTLELMPLSVLRLGVGYEYISYFGNMGFMQSFDAYDADASDAALDANKEAGEHYGGHGTQLSFSALLQAKVGPIAVRSKAVLGRVDYALRDSDIALFDPLLDILVPVEGWIWTNDLDALYVGDRFVAGLRHSAVDAVYPDVDNSADPNGPIHRLGPLFVLQVAGDGTGVVSNVSAVALLQLYLSHRYRAGQEVTRALPYIGLGVIVEGSLL